MLKATFLMIMLLFIIGCQKTPGEMNELFIEARNEIHKGNYNKGIEMLEDLADDGHLLSQKTFAHIYAEGSIVKKDFDKAKYWLNKAAEQGDLEAKILYEKLDKENYQ